MPELALLSKLQVDKSIIAGGKYWVLVPAVIVPEMLRQIAGVTDRSEFSSLWNFCCCCPTVLNSTPFNNDTRFQCCLLSTVHVHTCTQSHKHTDTAGTHRNTHTHRNIHTSANDTETEIDRKSVV